MAVPKKVKFWQANGQANWQANGQASFVNTQFVCVDVKLRSAEIDPPATLAIALASRPTD